MTYVCLRLSDLSDDTANVLRRDGSCTGDEGDSSALPVGGGDATERDGEWLSLPERDMLAADATPHNNLSRGEGGNTEAHLHTQQAPHSVQTEMLSQTCAE